MGADAGPTRDPGADLTDAPAPRLRRRLRSAGLLALAVSAAAVGWACTEQPLTGPGPDEGEKDAAETVEMSISPSQMASWRDTTLDGFALPADADFVLAADEQDFRSRVLARFPVVPDSVVIDDDTVAVEEFRNGRVAFVLDTARSTVPDAGMTVRVLTLADDFDPEEATWQQASEGAAWQSPGGDFDQEVGRREITQPDDGVLADTIEVDLGSRTDSLLKAWRDSNGRPGIAGLVEGEGARAVMTSVSLLFDAKPADRDSTVALAEGVLLTTLPSTFIFDPPAPEAGEGLRLGGMPTSRFYVSFRPPEEIGGARIPGSTVNRAEVIFRPAPAPASPFALRDPVTAAGVRLLADPFELGARTPVGDTLALTRARLVPDSLAAGRPIRVQFTNLLARWASNPDSAGRLGVGVRLQPEAQSVGFWEFGSAASAAGLQPTLRVVFTPSSEFEVP